MGLCQSKKGVLDLQAFPYRHVLITGASSGIGAAVAVKLAGVPGMTLTLVARNQERLESVRAACKAQGAKVRMILADVANRDIMDELLRQVHQSTPLELVIANAGVAAQPSNECDLTNKLMEAAQANILGTLNTILPAVKLLRSTAAKGQPAAVAVLSSVSAIPPKSVTFAGHLQLGLLPYAWSKQSLLQLGEGLQAELDGSGVAVYTICPGVVLTDLATNWASFLMGADKKDAGSLELDAATHGQTATAAATEAKQGTAKLDSSAVTKISGTETAAVAHNDITSEQQSEAAEHGTVVTVGVVSHDLDTPFKAVQRKATIIDSNDDNDAILHNSITDMNVSNVSNSKNGSGGTSATSAGPGEALSHHCNRSSICVEASVERELRSQLGAMTPDEAAVEICRGLASGKGGMIAFPTQAVRRMKLMEKLPEKFLVRVVKKAMAKYKATSR